MAHLAEQFSRARKKKKSRRYIFTRQFAGDLAASQIHAGIAALMELAARISLKTLALAWDNFYTLRRFSLLFAAAARLFHFQGVYSRALGF